MATNFLKAKGRPKKAASSARKPASKSMAYLYLARDVYRFQKPIPVKLRPFYDGAANINLPTGTRDPKQARNIRDQLLAKCRAEFGRLTRELAAAGPNISQADIERIKAEQQVAHQNKLREEFWRTAEYNEVILLPLQSSGEAWR